MDLVKELSSLGEEKGFQNHDAIRKPYFQINTSPRPEIESKSPDGHISEDGLKFTNLLTRASGSWGSEGRGKTAQRRRCSTVRV